MLFFFISLMMFVRCFFAFLSGDYLSDVVLLAVFWFVFVARRFFAWCFFVFVSSFLDDLVFLICCFFVCGLFDDCLCGVFPLVFSCLVIFLFGVFFLAVFCCVFFVWWLLPGFFCPVLFCQSCVSCLFFLSHDFLSGVFFSAVFSYFPVTIEFPAVQQCRVFSQAMGAFRWPTWWEGRRKGGYELITRLTNQ